MRTQHFPPSYGVSNMKCWHKVLEVPWARTKADRSWRNKRMRLGSLWWAGTHLSWQVDRHVWSLCRSYLRCQLKCWGVLPSWGCGFRCDTCCMCRGRHFAEAACVPLCAVAELEGGWAQLMSHLERGRPIWSEFVISVGPANPDPICGLYVRELNACWEIEFLLHPPLLAGDRGSDSRLWALMAVWGWACRGEGGAHGQAWGKLERPPS